MTDLEALYAILVRKVRVGRVEEGRGVAERQRGATRRVCFRDSSGVLAFYLEFGWLKFEFFNSES